MALNWVNKQDNIDEVMADDVNSLAAAIVENERSIAKETGARSAKDNDLQSQVNKKVDKVEGMGLSSNDYTDEEKQKLGELPINAELRAEIEKKADKRTVEGGFAGGDNANTMNGGAVGNSASAGSGGAVGCGAKTGDGFAGGNGAVTVNEKGSAINAIQLGWGTNQNPKTLQVYDYQLMDADGNVPIERMAKEVEAREAKDAELQDKITAEASAREAKDAELQANIDAETQARIDEDASLHSSIDATNINMEMGDRELQANIDKKQDKVTISEYPEDNSELIYDLSIMHNQELRTKSTLANGITFVIPDSVYPNDYVTSLSFGAGGTAPQIGYTATGIINWVGTDCSVIDGKSIFAPKANTRYDIVIYFNGMQFVGLVNGFVPATIANGGATS